MFLQTKRETRPDSFGTLATLSVFCSNRFIIKTHYLSGSMLYVESDRFGRMLRVIRMPRVFRPETGE